MSCLPKNRRRPWPKHDRLNDDVLGIVRGAGETRPIARRAVRSPCTRVLVQVREAAQPGHLCTVCLMANFRPTLDVGVNALVRRRLDSLDNGNIRRNSSPVKVDLNRPCPRLKARFQPIVRGYRAPQGHVLTRIDGVHLPDFLRSRPWAANVAPPPASTAAGGYASVLGSAVSAVAVCDGQTWRAATAQPDRLPRTAADRGLTEEPARWLYRLVWDWLVRMVLVVSFGA